MRRWFMLLLAAPLALAALGATAARAQHADDLQPFYDADKIQLVPGDEGFVYEGEFPTGGLFARFTTDPGFDSESDFGLGLLPDDILSYNVLDNLYFWSALTEDFDDPAATTITIDNAIGADTVVGAMTGILDPGGIIGQANGDGDFHAHVAFTLSDGAPFGAYGLLLQLATDRAGIANSDPFFIVFNYGLDETTFEEAVDAFVAIPEPSSVILFAVGSIVVGIAGMRSRRARRP